MPLLKLIPYLFSSVDTEQRQDHHHMTIKEKKKRSLIGLQIYIYSLRIVSNSYNSKINPSKFSECMDKIKPTKFSEPLGKAKQFLRIRYQQGRAKKSRRRRQSRLTEVFKPSSDANALMGPIRPNEAG